jgi:hypothetical protein
VEWLADPARTGRGVGTPGGPAATAWVAARLAETGLRPAFSPSYLQTFDAPFRAVLGPGNGLALVAGGSTTPPGAAWQPFGFSDDGEVEAELVWVGHGISAPELGHDDYAGVDVKGKIVVVAEDVPRERDPRSPFADPARQHHGEWRTKAAAARAHGAAALLGVRDVWAHGGRDDLPPWRGHVSSRAGLVAARVTAAILGFAGVDVRTLAAPGEADGRPHSRPLGKRARVAVDVRRESAATANVAAILPGRDPAVAGECVIVGAHHDHLGLGGDASLAPDQAGVVHPGADDDASGVAAVLAVARAAARAGPARRTLVFVLFGAEELGLVGSAELVRRPPPGCAVDRMQLMVNLDMVGRLRDGRLYALGAGTGRGLRDLVTAAADRPPRLPLRLAFGEEIGAGDQNSFFARGVPVVFLFTGPHADYHRPTDTPDKIDPAGLVEVARLAGRVARDAADRDGRIDVVRSAAPAAPPAGEREHGYGAYLGAVPDFAERKEPGVLLSGVRSGSPAERAGLVAGDVLLGVGGVRLAGLADLARALRAHRPGEEVELEWERAGRRMSAGARLEERK